MAKGCNRACPYNTLYGCKAEEYNATCPMKPKTNADRIRAMSDEELAEDFCKTVLGVMEQLGIENTGSMEDAVRVRLKWLKQPVED